MNLRAVRWVLLEVPLLTADQFVVAVQMARHAREESWGEIFVSTERLSELTHLTRQRVIRARAELKALGVIETTGKAGKTMQLMVWRLCKERYGSGTLMGGSTVPEKNHSTVPQGHLNDPESASSTVPHRDTEVGVELPQEASSARGRGGVGGAPPPRAKPMNTSDVEAWASENDGERFVHVEDGRVFQVTAIPGGRPILQLLKRTVGKPGADSTTHLDTGFLEAVRAGRVVPEASSKATGSAGQGGSPPVTFRNSQGAT